MSGQQIGMVVGGVIGFYFGGPAGAQFGMAVGGAVGGAVDPETIRAPSIGDAQQQTTAAGVPRPVVYGHPAPFAGNLIDGEHKARKIIVTEGGKGGPEVKSERFLLTSAIRICEGPIAGVVRIWRNGEVVYDRRTIGDMPQWDGGSVFGIFQYIAEVRAWTSAFQQRARIYLGDEAQLPDPALEAIHGVGNTPYYRGTAYMVIEDDDVTDTRGACARYEFEVMAAGVNEAQSTETYSVGELSGYVNQHWPLEGPETDYTYVGVWGTGNGGGTSTPEFDSIAEVQAYIANCDATTGAFGTANVIGSPDHYVGYWGRSGNAVGDMRGSSSVAFDLVDTQPDATDLENVILAYQFFVPDDGYINNHGGEFCPLISDDGLWHGTKNGGILQKFPSAVPTPQYLDIANCGDGFNTRGITPLRIEARRKIMAPVSDGEVIPDTPEYEVLPDGTVQPVPVFSTASGEFKQLALAVISGVDPTREYTRYPHEPILALGDPDYSNSEFWTAAYDAAVTAGTLPAGWVYGSQYPVTVLSAELATRTAPDTIEATPITLASVVADIADRCGVPDANIDVSSLSDIIPGFLIGVQGAGADAIRPCQQMYYFDMPEYDGKIVAVKRGGASVATITDDDMLEAGDEDDDTRAQAIEFPLKVSVISRDPAAEYAPMPQTSPRFSSNVKALGEVSIASPIPFGADEAMQRACVIHAVLWARAEGRSEFELPEEWTHLVPSDCFERDGKRWLIESVEYADGAVRVKSVYDRASNYVSTATGIAAPLPVLPTGPLKGPTLLVAMNLPPLSEVVQEETGVYLAATGTFTGWDGCIVQMSVDGGVTYRTVASISRRSVMGSLLGDITTTTEPILVELDSGELSSTTADRIALGSNGFAMVSSNVAEIAQFETATEDSEGDYSLTTVTRAALGTTAAAHSTGDRFVMLENAVFLPVDSSLAGTTLYFRAVTNGTSADNNAVVTLPFDPVPVEVIIDGGEI